MMGQATRAFECLCFLLDILHLRSRQANNSWYSIGPFITSEVMGALSLTAQLSSLLLPQSFRFMTPDMTFAFICDRYRASY